MAGLARDNARMDLTLLHARSINADDLRGLYAFPDRPTLRMNFVATLDGAANGSDGRSGSINNPADKLVYDLNRELSQVVLVGAQTAHVEGFRPAVAGEPPVVAVTRSGLIPREWRTSPDAAGGGAILVTCADAATLAEARDLLGEEHVWVLGEHEVDLAAMKALTVEKLAEFVVEEVRLLLTHRLVAEGWTRILSEGGPRFFSALLAEGLVDELALSSVARLISGDHHPRITEGRPSDAHLTRRHLLDIDGTLIGLWDVSY